jgi:hypothetical protein
MAVEKRPLEHSLVNKRNVRARLVHRFNPEKSFTPILRPHRYTKASLLSNLSLKENIVESEGPLKDATSPLKRRITFYNKVSVVHIPSRHHYPELMRKSIWGTMREISENARRNTIEFAAEGWDWRAATEDDAMYVAPNGERVHPAHVRRQIRRKATV